MGRCHIGRFKFIVLRAKMVKEADAVAEQHRYQMNVYFIEQPGFQVLLNGIRTAHDHYVLVTCYFAGLLGRAVDAVREKGKCGRSLLDSLCCELVRKHNTKELGAGIRTNVLR